MTVTIDTSGIEDFGFYMESLPGVTSRAVSRALNFAAGVAVKAARKEIYEEVAYPSGYLEDGRLGQPPNGYSSPERLEARVSGRGRATSLARFTAPGTPVAASFAVKGKREPNPGVTVTVKPGRPKHFLSGFLYELKNGNVGFCIRLRPGDTVRSVDRYKPKQLFPGIFLLYGPSVDQVFQDVVLKVMPEVTSALETEFRRQFQLLANGA